MITVLIVSAVQALYWFLAAADIIMEFLLNALPLEIQSPPYLLRPFSALISTAPNVYVGFQCIFIPSALVCILFVLLSKNFPKRTKICDGISLFGLSTLLFMPFEVTALLNLCIDIPLLCFVIADYKKRQASIIL